MNRSAFQSSLLQQMVGAGGFPSWWNMSNLRTSLGDSSPHLLPLPSSSSPMSSLYESQELPQSWSQLLLGGLVLNEDERSFLGSPYQAKKMEALEEQMIYDSQGAAMGAQDEASWSQILPSSSPRSCITSSLNSSMLDFSNSKSARRTNPPLDLSPECNSTEAGGALKKARVSGSSSNSQSSTFKVRKEKLGDRITALHQLVSPFGKTDTASVLLEAIGYIRFLQGQIEALSSPYLAGGSGNLTQPAPEQRNCINFQGDPGQDFNEEPKKDLRSRGLCLVPVSCMLHVGGESCADYWSPSIGSSLG